MQRSVAVIGSFKQHNEQVQRLCASLRAAGAVVTSPVGVGLVQEGVDFVRFHTDDANSSDSAIQSLALQRILRADVVYAVLPNGYIGRTTCYEVGRVIQAKRPIYFSARPLDLPLHVPDEFIIDDTGLLTRLTDSDWRPTWLFANGSDATSVLERQLIDGTRHDA